MADQNVELINRRITIDPAIMVGKPVVTGTRIPVELILKRLAQDLDLQALFGAYPRLTPEDVRACIAYAQERVAGEEVYPVGDEDLATKRQWLDHTPDQYADRLSELVVISERGVRIRHRAGPESATDS